MARDTFALKGGDIGSFPFNYQGVFDYYRIYHHVIKWLEERKFKVHHVLYKDKPDGPGTREREIKIMGDVMIDEYHKWQVNILFETFFCAQITVDMPDGSKRQMMRGKIKTTVSGKTYFDYDDTFNTQFYRKMKHLLYRQLYNWRYKIEHWNPLYFALAELNQDIKQICHADTWRGSFDKGY